MIVVHTHRKRLLRPAACCCPDVALPKRPFGTIQGSKRGQPVAARAVDESMEAKDVAIRIAHFDDIGKIAAAYSNWGYFGGIAPIDTAWLAEVAGEFS